MLVKLNCPQCGAEMKIDDSRDVIFCEYCGTKVVNMAQKIEVTHKVEIDRSNEPNLIINYASSNMGVKMITRIVDTGRKDVYMSGQTLTFRLAPGVHKIVLKIGKINYNREITIPEDNTPVRINASWDRHANISIDQPEIAPVRMAAYSESTRTAPAEKAVYTSQPINQKEPAVNDAPMLQQIFNKGTIAPWILTGCALMFFIAFIGSKPISGILFLLTAAFLNPVTLYFADRKNKTLKILAFVAAGILATIAMYCAA